MINKRPEILAPCGNPAAFRAALSAGADAVYLALDRFGARAYAGNFTQNELLHTLEEAHLHDVKVYLTLNTLLKNEELAMLPKELDPLYKEGLDAVLVQDFGVADFLRERYPDLPLHASTQMNICSPESAKYVQSLGFTRVVPARELSLEEHRRIRETAGIEVEVFVHGALCVCYSGRCYLSSFAGGRSGNRGRCAQPCREKYNGAYLLSMKDLCTLEDIPELVNAGIDSFKIEGRMKNEYYVAACVDAYKTLTEECLQGTFSMERAKHYRERLAEVFNRGGFTRGYYYRHSGKDMLDEEKPGRSGIRIGTIRKVMDGEITVSCLTDLNRKDALEISYSETEEPIRLTVPEAAKKGETIQLRAGRTRMLEKGMPVIRVRNEALKEELEERFLEQGKKIPIRCKAVLKQGVPFTLTADTGSLQVSVTGTIPEIAKGSPVSDDVIRSKIGTLSDTDFVPEQLEIENEGSLFLPASEVKRLRRELVEKLRKELTGKFRRDSEPGNSDEIQGKMVSAQDPSEQGKIVFVSSPEAAEVLLPLGPEMIIFDFGLDRVDPDTIRSLYKKYSEKTAFLIGFPYIYRDIIPEDTMKELLELAMETDGAYISGLDTFSWLLHQKVTLRNLYLGAALYGYNDRAVEHFAKAAKGSADRVLMEAPYELGEEETDRIRVPVDVQRVTTVYGRLPMMITVQRGTDGTKETLTMNRMLQTDNGKDTKSGHPGRNGSANRLILYPVPEMCYNVILSGRPVLQSGGTKTAYRFTTEEKDRIEGIYLGHEKPEGFRHRGLL